MRWRPPNGLPRCASRSQRILPGLRVERVHHVADLAGLAGQLDVAIDDTLDDFLVREPLLGELGGVVVAVDAGGRRLERARADRRRDEHAIAPDDRRRPAAARHLDRPRDVLGRRPALGQRRLVGDAGPAGPRNCGHSEGRSRRWSRQPTGQSAEWQRSVASPSDHTAAMARGAISVTEAGLQDAFRGGRMSPPYAALPGTPGGPHAPCTPHRCHLARGHWRRDRGRRSRGHCPGQPGNLLEQFRLRSREAEAKGLAEPFTGITANGRVEPGLFPVRSTGVSTEPVRAAAAAFLAALTAEQRQATTFPVDDPEWRKWMNQHFYVRQGVSFEEMSAAAARGGVRPAARVAQREGAEADARHHAAQPHARRAERQQLRRSTASGSTTSR